MSGTFKGLRIYNTLTRSKEDFVPLDDDHVRMYVCGPTVYDYAHIGNARPVIVFDVLFRLLRHLYGEDHVAYVRNITDVDDKINARARDMFPDLPLNEAIRRVTETTARQFHEDVAALGCLPPTVEPRATETIPEMIALIVELIDNGHAYVAEGHVLFDVKSWKAADGSAEYGKLSRRSLDDMIAGARVEVAPYKRDPMDFVLWKPSSAEEPGWESPWGRGRPGWHIECSAMSDKWLWDAVKGELSPEALAHPHEFDIHGGGIDLTFPHHENEIAQSRCAHGTPMMARYWMHNGFLQVEGQKMSKSLGNFITINDLLKTWPGEVIRLNMLRTHYRQPIDWTTRSLEESFRLWNRWLGLIDIGPTAKVSVDVIEPLLDDLNTWEAVRRLDELSQRASGGDEQAREQFVATARFLGLIEAPDKIGFAFPGVGFQADPIDELTKLLRALPSSLTVGWLRNWLVANDLTAGNGFPDVLSVVRPIDKTMSLWELKRILKDVRSIYERCTARLAFIREKNWAEADKIRDELLAQGIQLKDGKDPETGERVTTWEVKR